MAHRHIRLAAVALFAVAFWPATGWAQQSIWVRPGQTGRLVYLLDGQGDRIMDFSPAGYHNGAEIPEAAGLGLPVVQVAPRSGDDGAHIQAAIDQVSALPMRTNGFRGVVQLTTGQFEVAGTLSIRASGVILRGVGDGSSAEGNTIIRATGTTQRTVLTVGSGLGTTLPVAANSTSSVVDKVVPAGATSLRVSNAGLYRVGESVIVKRHASQAWIDSLGGVSAQSWTPGESRFSQIQERVITRIEGDRLFFDAPLAHSIDTRMVTGSVYRYSERRIANVGVEGIRLESEFDAGKTAVVGGRTVYTDENHAWTFLEFREVRDGWARNLTGKNLGYATVTVSGSARSITVRDCRSLAPVSLIAGGRRYGFSISGGQFILMRDLLSEEGRHDFNNNSAGGGYNRGPNVFFNGTATGGFSDQGPHQRYVTGTLYDNVMSDTPINVRDRGSWGTGHGWTAANVVVWNSRASRYVIQNPPGAQNWLIGATGGPVVANDAPDAIVPSNGYVDSLGQRVRLGQADNPLDSLYAAQVGERERYAAVRMREYWIGDFDDFEYDGAGSADDAAAAADWLSAIEAAGIDSGAPLAGFDHSGPRLRSASSLGYALGADELVVWAVVTMALKETGDGAEDRLWIESPTRSVSLASLGALPTFGQAKILTLEFTPGDPVFSTGLLQDGRLDLLVSDGHSVDWVHLLLYVRSGPVSRPGDLDGDGDLDESDLALLLVNWGLAVGAGRGNLDGQGVVDDFDLNILLANWTGPVTAQGVPEPGSLTLLTVGAALLHRRGRGVGAGESAEQAPRLNRGNGR